MKKYWLSAVFLSTAFPFAAAAQTATVEAFDQPVELQLGGYMTWYGTYTNQKRTTLKQTGPASATPIGEYNNFDLMGNAEIYFQAPQLCKTALKSAR